MNFGLSFPVLITPINEGMIVSEEKYEVHACEAEHSVTTFSYLFKEKKNQELFILKKLLRLVFQKERCGISYNKGKKLQLKINTIKPSQVLGPNVSGKKIGVSGDTRPNKKLEKFFRNCDYLIFDSTFSDELREKAIQSCHSTAKEAAVFAKNADVKNLILTHFSARYKDEKVLLNEAKSIHNSVITANDQLKIDVV